MNSPVTLKRLGADAARFVAKEKKLYISPAGTGESVLFKTATAPAN